MEWVILREGQEKAGSSSGQRIGWAVEGTWLQWSYTYWRRVIGICRVSVRDASLVRTLFSLVRKRNSCFSNELETAPVQIGTSVDQLGLLGRNSSTAQCGSSQFWLLGTSASHPSLGVSPRRNSSCTEKKHQWAVADIAPGLFCWHCQNFSNWEETSIEEHLQGFGYTLHVQGGVGVSSISLEWCVVRRYETGMLLRLALWILLHVINALFRIPCALFSAKQVSPWVHHCLSSVLSDWNEDTLWICVIEWDLFHQRLVLKEEQSYWRIGHFCLFLALMAACNHKIRDSCEEQWQHAATFICLKFYI